MHSPCAGSVHWKCFLKLHEYLQQTNVKSSHNRVFIPKALAPSISQRIATIAGGVTTHNTPLILTAWWIHFLNVIQVMNTLEKIRTCTRLFCEQKQRLSLLEKLLGMTNRVFLEINSLEQKTSIWTFSWCSAYLFRSRIFKFVNQVKLKMQKLCVIWTLHYML